MKLLPILLCAAVLSLGLGACSTTPKKTQTASCCSKDGSCEAPHKKNKH